MFDNTREAYHEVDRDRLHRMVNTVLLVMLLTQLVFPPVTEPWWAGLLQGALIGLLLVMVVILSLLVTVVLTDEGFSPDDSTAATSGEVEA